MEKKLPLIVFALFLSSIDVNAQSCKFFEHSFGFYFQYMEGFQEMQDNNILTCTRLMNADSTGCYTNDYGYCFLKLNREDGSVMDSVFVPSDNVRTFLMEPNPLGDDYLFIRQEYDAELDCNFLKISHFDEDIVFHEDEQITVLLQDTVFGGEEHFLLEEESFIMINGRVDGSMVVQRFGFDGTLLDRKMHTDSAYLHHIWRGFRKWNDSSREYVISGYNYYSRKFDFFVLDSLLNIKEFVELEEDEQYPNIWFVVNDAFNRVENLDDNTYLLATEYEEYPSYHPEYSNGIQVTKRDKATHSNQKTIYFMFPELNNGIFINNPYVMDVLQTKDGYIYLAFGDQAGLNKMGVALLDRELNVIWQQYYILLDQGNDMCQVKEMQDGGLGMVGYYVNYSQVFALFIHNDYDALEEQGVIVRPYMFYPNPVSDNLNFQYSPDVQPSQIELYDLQGRMVLTQSGSLEQLNLQGLSSGEYLMNVTLENGKTFTDKVVKQ